MKLVSVLVLSVLLVTPAWAQFRARPAPPAPTDARAILRSLEEAFTAVADRVTPAVVNVSTVPARGRGEDAERFREFFGEELYERYFRRRPREDARASGSGVIVDPKGYILTNNHVIENARDITVRLSDARKLSAKLVGRDPKTDLAVLKVEAPGPLPAAELGDSDALRVGQWAIAIGNPFGLDRTVTVGIVSATARNRVGLTTYENFIQTDASINPGNSGGPLLNLDGRVIGINTAIVASGQGIGFSIPINEARSVMSQLIARGRVVRGWLGVSRSASGSGCGSGGGSGSGSRSGSGSGCVWVCVLVRRHVEAAGQAAMPPPRVSGTAAGRRETASPRAAPFSSLPRHGLRKILGTRPSLAYVAAFPPPHRPPSGGAPARRPPVGA